ncbi:ATP-binding protein [Fructobacillus sp. M2-14]|uniref:ATP-binding protein n=1 Tax=Fructobacillus broussonetiae TaxID=2713173 RepID=A0ABS5QZD5_9LACO|nr:ATP-binding protein [Fructobacillus broussonetiae]MBS9338520.1 ATP-binding protein [Fructobacillus broussonetiae]
MQNKQMNHSLFLGKGRFGRSFNISYEDLLAKHLLITGQTGSGKSTSAKQIVSELQEKDVTNIIFDPTGEYGLDLNNLVSYRLSQNAFIDLSNRSAEELLMLFDLHWDSTVTSKLQEAMTSLRIQAKRRIKGQILSKVNLAVKELEKSKADLTALNQDYEMTLLPKQMIEEFARPFADESADYSLCGQEIDHDTVQKYWSDIQQLNQLLQDEVLNSIFHFTPVEKQGTQYELSFILQTFENRRNMKRSLVVNLSPLQAYPGIQQRVLSYLMDRVLMNRVDSKVNLPVAIFLDEAHRYLPVTEAINENGLFHLLREGRKHNLNVVVSTQSLKDLPAELRGQFGANLIHRYQSYEELIGLGLSPKKMKKLPNLAVGEALLLTTSKKSQILSIQKPRTM